ncbi:hypothetical protein [Siccirubricoccus sp. G192]|uniref:hypothetical protein n=1 Tax=Siccirubricoccus sp. G192 TaxID=2849651 RepID=UPI001C2C2DC9|nr:hypothetical protein [Siccirubricoccus sp. G192]MBV1800472.1 hypothetical protein [Siccirubricoccus sp. G192]
MITLADLRRVRAEADAAWVVESATLADDLLAMADPTARSAAYKNLGAKLAETGDALEPADAARVEASFAAPSLSSSSSLLPPIKRPDGVNVPASELRRGVVLASDLLGWLDDRAEELVEAGADLLRAAGVEEPRRRLAALAAEPEHKIARDVRIALAKWRRVAGASLTLRNLLRSGRITPADMVETAGGSDTDALDAVMSFRILVSRRELRGRLRTNAGSPLPPSTPPPVPVTIGSACAYLAAETAAWATGTAALLQSRTLSPIENQDVVWKCARDGVRAFPAGTSARTDAEGDYILAAATLRQMAATRDGLQRLLNQGLLTDGDCIDADPDQPWQLLARAEALGRVRREAVAELARQRAAAAEAERRRVEVERAKQQAAEEEQAREKKCRHMQDLIDEAQRQAAAAARQARERFLAWFCPALVLTPTLGLVAVLLGLFGPDGPHDAIHWWYRPALWWPVLSTAWEAPAALLLTTIGATVGLIRSWRARGDQALETAMEAASDNVCACLVALLLFIRPAIYVAPLGLVADAYANLPASSEPQPFGSLHFRDCRRACVVLLRYTRWNPWNHEANLHLLNRPHPPGVTLRVTDRQVRGWLGG